MNIIKRRARGGDNHLSVSIWTDEIGRPLVVEQVTATLFYLDGDQGGARSVLEGPIAMNVADKGHRYISIFALPESDYNGKTLYVDFDAVLSADGSTLHMMEVIEVDEPLSNQSMKVSF